MNKTAFNTVMAVTFTIYLVVYMTVGITGLWWLVAIFAFVPVTYVSAMLSSLLFPHLFESEDEDEEDEAAEDAISTAAHVMVVSRGAKLGTYMDHPIYETLDIRGGDGVVRKFSYLRTSSNEAFTSAPADRWIVTNGLLYVYNNPVPQPESTVK